MLLPIQGNTGSNFSMLVYGTDRLPKPPPSLPKIMLEYIMAGITKPEVIPDMSDRIRDVMKAFRPSVKYGETLYVTPTMEDGSSYELDYVGDQAFVRIYEKTGVLYSQTPFPENTEMARFIKKFISNENVLAEWEAWAELPAPGELRATALQRIRECITQNNPVLNLSNLNLSSIPQYLPIHIKTLELNFNYLTTLPFLHDGLESVEVYFNKLSSLPPDYPASLIKLNANYNCLTSLPDFPNTLMHIYLNSNKLKHFHGIPLTVTAIDFGDNPIDCDELPDFSLFRNLEILCLENLRLKTVPPLPPTLQWLGLNMNPLGQLPDLSGLDKLLTLRIDNTNITKLPPLPRNLTTLRASQNKISTLPRLPPDLGILLMSENDLTAAEELPCLLQQVDLCHNQLRHFCVNLPNLRELKLADNKIAHLYGEFSKMLTIMDITRNQIRELPPLPTSLIQLHIGFNRIILPPPDLPSLKSFSDESNDYNRGLHVVREELQLKEKDVAEAMKTSVEKIIQTEQCGSDVNLGMLKRYAEAMGCQLSLSIELEGCENIIPVTSSKKYLRSKYLRWNECRRYLHSYPLRFL